MLVTNRLAPLREALAKNDAEQFASKEPEPCPLALRLDLSNSHCKTKHIG